jgi:hypothetical protein
MLETLVKFDMGLALAGKAITRVTLDTGKTGIG